MARAVRGRKAPEGLEVCSVADSDEFIVVTWDVSSPVSSPVSLTRAEREVLALVIEGGSNAAVARARNTSGVLASAMGSATGVTGPIGALGALGAPGCERSDALVRRG